MKKIISCILMLCALGSISYVVVYALIGYEYLSSMNISISNNEQLKLLFIGIFIIAISTILLGKTLDKGIQKADKAIKVDINQSSKTKSIKINFNDYEEIIAKQRKILLIDDQYDIKVNDIVKLKQTINGTVTGNEISKRVKYVLKGCLDDGLKNGYCIIQF